MIHAITCYFNPCGYRNLRDNLHRFHDAFRDTFHSCPLTVIELSFDGRFELDDSLRVVGDPAKHLMWQKERLLNIAEQSLPPNVDNVAILDCDIMFLNKLWVDEAVEQLETSKVVQLFSRVHYLNAHGSIGDTFSSIVGAPVLTNASEEQKVAPGFAWAMHRDMFPLLDSHILGGGDRLMYEAWVGRHNASRVWRAMRAMNPAWRRHFAKEGITHFDKCRGLVERIRGDIIHMYHGSMRNRRYIRRWQALSSHNYDPATDIQLDDNGLWAWASNKPQMHAKVREHFSLRQEDDNLRDTNTSRTAASRLDSVSGVFADTQLSSLFVPDIT